MEEKFLNLKNPKQKQKKVEKITGKNWKIVGNYINFRKNQL